MAEVKNLLDLLRERAEQTPNGPATSHKDGGAWRETSWLALRTSVRKLAATFLRLGIQPGDRVALFAATRQEWVIADQAIMSVGGIVVPIYGSNTAEEARHILKDSGAVCCVVDNDVPDGRQPGRLSRVKQAAKELAGLRLVALDDATDPEVTSLRPMLQDPTPEELAEIDKRTAAQTLDSLATLLYTSGTTGNPKGVELTHGAWVYEAKAVREIGLLQADRERVLLFLPLAHSFAKVIEAAWLSLGFTLVFAESVDKVVDNCGEVHPTVLPAVPRIFEKVYLKVIADGSAAKGLSGTLFRSFLTAFEEAAQNHFEGKPPPFRYVALRKVVYPKIKAKLEARLGGSLRMFVSGGAPLSRKLAFFFQEAGFEILEGYGLTETSAGTCVNPPGKARLGTVGPPLPGTQVKIAPSDGEILIRGPGVMRGYYGKPAETREVLDPDGWFHTGDIGEIDRDGYVRITDRKKDIIVTAGGKNVAPQNLENDLKTAPIISQVVIHGDRRKFLSALITVNEDEGKKLLTAKGIPFVDYADLCHKAPIREAVDAAIGALNAAQPSHNSIKKWAVLTRDFTQETGELTPTMKVKRKVVTEAYRSLLDSFYDEKMLD